ncbi:MAG: MerR family transcriptional regulator [Balneolaceae bacterium]
MIKQYFTLRDFENITGIDANTMRVWKKRYGILKPWKVISGSMQYTQSDLKYLLHVKLLLDSGMRISDITAMKRETMLEHVQARMLNKSIGLSNRWETKLTNAVYELNQKKLEKCYREVLEYFTFIKAMREIFLPFFKKCGQLWELESMDVIQEHFLSNFIRTKVLTATDYLPSSNKPFDYLLFLPEPELHEIPLLFTNYFLLSNRRNTLYLGASVPYKELKAFLSRQRIKKVVTGWMYTGEVHLHLNNMTELISRNPGTAFYLCVPDQNSELFEEKLKKANCTNASFFKGIEELEKLSGHQKPDN